MSFPCAPTCSLYTLMIALGTPKPAILLACAWCIENNLYPKPKPPKETK